MPHVLSANRLADGIVVFLAEDGGWVERIGDAAILADKAALEAGMERARAATAANVVVEAAPVEVDATPAGVRPRHVRDRIRAMGPTVRLDHGKQAALG